MRKKQSSYSKPAAKRKPRPSQRRGVEWLVSHAGAGLFIEPGGGKTAIALRAILALKQAGVDHRTLVVAPLRVAYKVWPVEGAEWAGTEWAGLSDLKIELLHGDNKEAALERDADIYVINFEGLKWLLADGGSRLKQLDVANFIVDESSKLKNTRTHRFRMLKPILNKFQRRWILTGTPTPKSYLDLFGQIYTIDLGRALGRFITHYRFQYFTPLDRFGWQWVLKAGAEKQIQEAVAPYVFQLDPGDYAKLPELIESIARVDLPAKARKVYDEIEEEMITELTGNHVVTAVSTGAAYAKCAQIANGGLYHDAADKDTWGRRTWSNLHDAKLETVVDIVDELNGVPTLIVYEFLHDLDRLRRAFGADTPYIGGGVNEKKSGEIIDRWNRSELPVLLVHPLTISHGLNMQYGAGQHVIWHSLTWDWEAYDQLNRRLRRSGSQHKNIFVHLVVATDTVDEAKLRALRVKEKRQRQFLAALKEYALSRKNARN